MTATPQQMLVLLDAQFARLESRHTDECHAINVRIDEIDRERLELSAKLVEDKKHHDDEQAANRVARQHNLDAIEAEASREQVLEARRLEIKAKHEAAASAEIDKVDLEIKIIKARKEELLRVAREALDADLAKLEKASKPYVKKVTADATEGMLDHDAIDTELTAIGQTLVNDSKADASESKFSYAVMAVDGTTPGLDEITASPETKTLKHSALMRQTTLSLTKTAPRYASSVIPVQTKALSPGNAQIIPRLEDAALQRTIARIKSLHGAEELVGNKKFKVINVTIDNVAPPYRFRVTNQIHTIPATPKTVSAKTKVLKDEKAALEKTLKDDNDAGRRVKMARIRAIDTKVDHMESTRLKAWEKTVSDHLLTGEMSDRRLVGENALRQKQEIGIKRPLFEPNVAMRPKVDWNGELCECCYPRVSARIEYVLNEKLDALNAKWLDTQAQHVGEKPKDFAKLKNAHEKDEAELTALLVAHASVDWQRMHDAHKAYTDGNVAQRLCQEAQDCTDTAIDQNVFYASMAAQAQRTAMHKALFDKYAISKRFGAREFNPTPKQPKKKTRAAANQHIGNCIRLHDLCGECNKLFQWKCTKCENQLNENFDNIATAPNLKFRAFSYTQWLDNKVDKAICLRCLVREACYGYGEHSEPENINHIRIYKGNIPIGISGDKQNTPPTATDSVAGKKRKRKKKKKKDQVVKSRRIQDCL
jgi:hypothetical protein